MPELMPEFQLPPEDQQPWYVSGLGADQPPPGALQSGDGFGQLPPGDPSLPSLAATGGSALTTIDTESVQTFAGYVQNQLLPNVRYALQQLQTVNPNALPPGSVAAGDFWEASLIESAVGHPDSGLVGQYIKILQDLDTCLTGIVNGLNSISANYQTADAYNAMTAGKLNGYLASAVSDFNQLGNLGSGSGSGGSGGSGGG